jgi:hypothetical protein
MGGRLVFDNAWISTQMAVDAVNQVVPAALIHSPVPALADENRTI